MRWLTLATNDAQKEPIEMTTARWLPRMAAAAVMLCLGASVVFAAGPRTISVRSSEGPIEKRARALPWPKPSPQRVRYVAPVYPADLAGGVGVVTLHVTTAPEGQVVEARASAVTLHGPVADAADDAIGTAFVDAAITAVKGWAYEPSRRPLTFLANVVVRSDGVPSPQPSEGPAPRLEERDGKVRALKRAAAVHPASARAQGIQGVIVLEAGVGRDGRVTDARVLRHIPHLDTAALDAVALWQFDPRSVFGESGDRFVTIEILVNFALP